MAIEKKPFSASVNRAHLLLIFLMISTIEGSSNGDVSGIHLHGEYIRMKYNHLYFNATNNNLEGIMNVSVNQHQLTVECDTWTFQFPLDSKGYYSITSIDYSLRDTNRIVPPDSGILIRDKSQNPSHCSRPYGWYNIIDMPHRSQNVAVDFVLVCQGRSRAVFQGSIRHKSPYKLREDLDLCRKDTSCQRQIQDQSALYLHAISAPNPNQVDKNVVQDYQLSAWTSGTLRLHIENSNLKVQSGDSFTLIIFNFLVANNLELGVYTKSATLYFGTHKYSVDDCTVRIIKTSNEASEYFQHDSMIDMEFDMKQFFRGRLRNNIRDSPMAVYARVESDYGHLIGDGRSETYIDVSPKLETGPDGRHALQLQFGPYSANFMVPNDRFYSKFYYGAFSRGQDGSPPRTYMNMHVNQEACHDSVGEFILYDLTVSRHGYVSSVGLDFIIRCEATVPKLYGWIRVNNTLPITDSDKDSIPDLKDNCPLYFNPSQMDNDNDGRGDVCDNQYARSRAFVGTSKDELAMVDSEDVQLLKSRGDMVSFGLDDNRVQVSFTGEDFHLPFQPYQFRHVHYPKLSVCWRKRKSTKMECCQGLPTATFNIWQADFDGTFLATHFVAEFLQQCENGETLSGEILFRSEGLLEEPTRGDPYLWQSTAGKIFFFSVIALLLNEGRIWTKRRRRNQRTETPRSYGPVEIEMT